MLTKKWPKKLPKLSKEQRIIKDDFMKLWHEILPKKYKFIEIFDHNYPIILSPSAGTTLEIGSGLGEHIYHEDLTKTKYYALELRKNMSQVIKTKFPNVTTITADCQKKIKLHSNFFDRIIAIHVLEHLPNLPATIKELNRLLKSDGKLIVVIPCEGGLLYQLSRRISAQRVFEKKYKQSYKWLIESEHVSKPNEIIDELKKVFKITNKTYFPFLIPSIDINLCIGITMQKK